MFIVFSFVVFASNLFYFGSLFLWNGRTSNRLFLAQPTAYSPALRMALLQQCSCE